ncbi:RNA polymerase subunit sigma [Leptospira wolffii]|uniref:RNA polymerase subunit sigma n=1 Tax=Leptospira wolffii TaxID=409998 RepID=A0A2M9ZEG0_9LEPT|nr:sigma-70 family RNA polymerase sigma factor [Leptospira wolffii]PJZ66742.1 RNA polymerase subunit sigma [Leptospira wolffii]
MSKTLLVQDEFTEAIRIALEGHPRAMEDLLRKIQDYVFNLSLRMLWDPMEAEDATQEILLKVSRNLENFRFESKFTTWIYSISSNHLLSVRKPKNMVSLSKLREELLVTSRSSGFEEQIEDKMLEEEIRFGCVHAVLLKLGSSDRLVFILSSIYGMNSEEGAKVVGISSDSFRQKLSRSKKKLSGFLSVNCGMWTGNKACPCLGMSKHLLRENKENVGFFSALKKLKKKNPSLTDPQVSEHLKKLDRLGWIYQSQGIYESPSAILENIFSKEEE